MSGRVVQVLTQTTGGPVDHARDVAVELARRGVDSHVLGPHPAGAAGSAGLPGVTWHDVSIAGKTDVGGARDALALLRRLRPGVVHAHDRRAGWLARLAAPVLGAPVVYTLHGVPDGLSDLVAGNVRAAERRRRDRLYYLTGERLVTRWGRARVVVPSAAVAEYAVARVGLPERVVTVVPNGVDPARWRPTPPPAGPVTVVWSGVLGGVKRVDLLLDAVAAVPGVRALVVGDGPERPRVERRLADPALAGRVELTGWLADPAPAYARGHLLALTSAAENLPLSVLQAMACGRPIVATAVGGVPEAVRDGVEGLLAPADDPAAFAAALRTMAEDDGLRERAGKAARNRVETAYSLAGCVDGLEQVYAEAREVHEVHAGTGAGR